MDLHGWGEVSTPIYKIVSWASITMLEQDVCKWMEQDYEPIGGVTVGSDGRFYQAIRLKPKVGWSEVWKP